MQEGHSSPSQGEITISILWSAATCRRSVFQMPHFSGISPGWSKAGAILISGEVHLNFTRGNQR